MSHESQKPRAKATVMITGAAGFIGTALRQSLRLEYDLVCVDLLPPLSKDAGEDWHQIDITNKQAVAQLFQSLPSPLAGLIHLAWYYDFSNRPHPRYQAAVDGVVMLAEAFGRHATPDAPFVFASSMAAMAPTVPGVKLRPESPRSEAWQYPASKVRGERALRTTAIAQPVVELVLAGVYSSFCELVPLYQSIERIRLGSFQSWFYPGRTDRGLTYVHIDDVTEAFRNALRTSYPKSPKVERLLVGETSAVTNQTIFDLASTAFNRSRVPKLKVPASLAALGAGMIALFSKDNFVQPWMPKFAEEHFEFDLSRTEQVLGWLPKKRLLDTLPTMLSLATNDNNEWLTRNRRRPWRRQELPALDYLR